MKEIETERLYLRKLKREDAQTMFDNWANDPEVTKYMTWNPHKSVDETYAIVDKWLAEYANHDCYRWGIERKSDKVLMGMIDVVEYRDGSPEIGYCSGKKFWGNGYMTEALKAVVEQLFSDGYETLLIEALKANIGSNRVIQKAGFEFIETSVHPVSQIKPEPVEINFYRLNKQ